MGFSRYICPTHSFDVSMTEAKKIQSELREYVVLSGSVPDDVEVIGGADVAFLKNPYTSYNPAENSNNNHDTAFPGTGKTPAQSTDGTVHTALAVIVTLDVKTCRILETVYATAPVFFPYIPGFLSFREGPAVLAAFRKLKTAPGVMMYDGCGIAHPRGFGLASHMAVLTGVPSVGCAKSLLCGACDDPLPEKGNWTALHYKNEYVGSCLRTRNNVRPVYVSPGSGFSVDSARELVLSFTGKYRLPEPTRLAHNFVTAKKKEYMSNGV